MVARLLKQIVGSGLLLLLTACSSTPSTIEYYVLGSTAQPWLARAAENTDTKAVVLETVQLASFLRQPGLVMKTGANQLVVSRTHLWAETLDRTLPRVLLQHLQQSSDSFEFYQGKSDWTGLPGLRLRLRIDNLQPTDDGDLIATGRYQIRGSKDARPLLTRDFSLSQSLQRDGYAYAVTQMDALLAELAQSIVQDAQALTAR